MGARDTNARRTERETVADRSRVGISNRKTRRSISVILIRKYNDRRSRLAAGAGRDRVNKRKRKVEGKGSGRFRWRSLRTQVAAHLLRADSNCYPYLRVPLRHCSPPVWLAALPGLQCIRECVYNVYLFTVYFV